MQDNRRKFCFQLLISALMLLGMNMYVCAQSFVSTNGVHLEYKNKPYRFVGTNFWYGPILGSVGQGGNRERLETELDSLKSMGISNLRVLIGSDGERGVKTKVEPTLQIAPGVYNDTLLDGLDYFMAELQKRDMQAVLYFNNSWEWSGGYAFYLEHAGEGRGPLSSEVSWSDYCEFYSRFSVNQKAQELFYDHIRYIIGRTNRYTGRPYTDDPSIFAWQIGNEPRAFSKKTKEPFRKWMGDAAALIRSLDKNHLISTGSEGMIGCEVDMNLYTQICSDPNIDIINIHIWPSNWGWCSKDAIKTELPESKRQSLDYINQHIKLANTLQKPLVIEEFGYPRDGGSKSLDSNVECRDEYYSFVFNQLLQSAEMDGPLAGVNFWGWGGSARPTHNQWQPGDDYACDPAHEPQGWYSVFDSDTSTVNLIRATSANLSRSVNYAMRWRGVMIDVSRHFMPIEYLYKEVDAMSHFGLNRLHLHLTDDAGWRMEIKSRPRLTEVGAWRSHKTWKEWNSNGNKYSDAFNGFGGYYTQEELRKLVSYAESKGVTIVPEIEFPAHSREVVAAYPEVGFNENEFDMSKPESYELMRDVLEEVADVFPSVYLHVGGDEASTQHELQPQAMRQIFQIVDSLNRRMIAWDEALTDIPVDSNIVIMVWRNSEIAAKAAALGHEVILTPGKYCYLDKAQDSPLTEPAGAGGYLPIDSVYALPNPLSAKCAKKLLGMQVNMWAERIETPQHAEYMLWPRAYAVAELGQTGLTEERDFTTFHQRAIAATDFLRNNLGVNCFDLRTEVGERSVQNPVKSIKFELTYNTQPHKAYLGSGNDCLKDGIFGGWNNNDGRWQGFIGKGGMDVLLDLGEVKKISHVEGDFLQSCGPDIFFPYNMVISVSKDGRNYKTIYDGDYSGIYAAKQEDYRQLEWNGNTKARYVRVQALPGPKRGWVFCSELIVK